MATLEEWLDRLPFRPVTNWRSMPPYRVTLRSECPASFSYFVRSRLGEGPYYTLGCKDGSMGMEVQITNHLRTGVCTVYLTMFVAEKPEDPKVNWSKEGF